MIDEVIRLSRLSDYAIMILCELVGHDIVSADYLHNKTGISKSAVVKILKLLSINKILGSIQGPKGGYYLIKKADEISIKMVVQAVDGPVALTLCNETNSQNHQNCDFVAICMAKQGWLKINQEIKDILEKYKISDFVG